MHRERQEAGSEAEGGVEGLDFRVEGKVGVAALGQGVGVSGGEVDGLFPVFDPAEDREMFEAVHLGHVGDGNDSASEEGGPIGTVVGVGDDDFCGGEEIEGAGEVGAVIGQAWEALDRDGNAFVFVEGDRVCDRRGA